MNARLFGQVRFSGNLEITALSVSLSPITLNSFDWYLWGKWSKRYWEPLF